MNCSPLISIIVPIYNVDNYLEKCLNSILKQTYKNLEIILIDDESLDRSGIICDKFAKKDSRIIVIHQKNQGVSGARNAGLNISHGEYIGFIDPDDYAHPELISNLFSAISESSADIAICGYNTVGIRNDRFKLCNAVWSGEEALNKLVLNKEVTSHLWNKLFRKKIFDGLRFDLGKRYEDVRLIHKLFMRAQRVVAIEETLYDYFLRTDSITGTTQYNNSQEFIESLESRCEDLRDTNSYYYAKMGEFYCIRRIIYEIILNKYNKNIYYTELLNKEKDVYLEAKNAMSFGSKLSSKFFLLTPYIYTIVRFLIAKIIKK